MRTTEPKTHRARKKHWCELCGDHIQPGQRYTTWRYFGACDDVHVHTVRAHVDCWRLCDLLDIRTWDLDDPPIWYGIDEMSPDEVAREATACEDAAIGAAWVAHRAGDDHYGASARRMVQE